MSETIAVHVRYKSLYISLLSSAKQQREMTNFALSEERELKTVKFLKFYFKFIAVSQIHFRDSFDGNKQNNSIPSIPRLVGKIQIPFSIDVVSGLAVVAS